MVLKKNRKSSKPRKTAGGTSQSILPIHIKSVSPRIKRKQEKGREPPRKPITGRRLWLFRVIAILVVPILLLLFLELVLRLAGYGYPTSAFIQIKVQEKSVYCNNNKFGWRFFPRHISRNMDPITFAPEKPSDTYRIFILGASAARGTPDGAFGFGRFLQVMLQANYPGIDFELIPAAMPALNSHAVLEIARDSTRHEGDLFIVYLGHNEVVGPYGAGTVFAPISSHLSLIRAGIALQSTRLGQLLKSISESIGTTKDVPKVWRGMEMFLEKQIRLDDPRLQTVYQHFRTNLKDIVDAIHASGGPLMVCTVGSNLRDSPPFASLHRENLAQGEKMQWEKLYEQGKAYEDKNKLAEAVDSYLTAAEIDDSFADLQFRLGRCYENLEEYDRSRRSYIQARELDTLRFRADNQINHIIHTVAGNQSDKGIYLVETAEMLSANSPHGIPGEEVFYEHVHLNFKGNYLVARMIFAQLTEVLPDPIRRREAENADVLTEAECAQRLTYTDWNRYKNLDAVLTGFITKPPFTNQLYHQERVRQLEQSVKDLRKGLTPPHLKKIADQYRQALQEDPSDRWLYWKYAELLMDDLKNDREAARNYRWVKNHYPHDSQAYAKLGLIMGKLGRLDDAVTLNLQALHREPSHAFACFNLGLAYQFKNMIDESMKYYSQAIEFKPDHAHAYSNLGILLYQQGNVEKALETFKAGLSYVPDDLDLHYNLAVVLNSQGRPSEAREELRRALQIDPDSRKVLKFLKSIE